MPAALQELLNELLKAPSGTLISNDSSLLP